MKLPAINPSNPFNTTKDFPSKSITNDPLFVHPSDNPSMPLVSIQLNRTNFVSWNQAIRIALGAKLKLGFIDGKCTRPDVHTNLDRAELWDRVDCLIRSWLFNSISKRTGRCISVCPSANVLWDSIEQRYGQKNGPLLYQLQREISSIS